MSLSWHDIWYKKLKTETKTVVVRWNYCWCSTGMSSLRGKTIPVHIPTHWPQSHYVLSSLFLTSLVFCQMISSDDQTSNHFLITSAGLQLIC